MFCLHGYHDAFYWVSIWNEPHDRKCCVIGEVLYVNHYYRIKRYQCSLEADALKLGVKFVNSYCFKLDTKPNYFSLWEFYKHSLMIKSFMQRKKNQLYRTSLFQFILPTDTRFVHSEVIFPSFHPRDSNQFSHFQGYFNLLILFSQLFFLFFHVGVWHRHAQTSSLKVLQGLDEGRNEFIA